MRHYPLVEVEWIDSASNGEWHNPDVEMRVVGARSVGYLKESKRHQVVIMQSIGETQIQGMLAIPRTCVKKIRKLK